MNVKGSVLFEIPYKAGLLKWVGEVRKLQYLIRDISWADVFPVNGLLQNCPTLP